MREHSSAELLNGNEIVQMIDDDAIHICARSEDEMVELYSTDNSVDATVLWDGLIQKLIREGPEGTEQQEDEDNE